MDIIKKDSKEIKVNLEELKRMVAEQHRLALEIKKQCRQYRWYCRKMRVKRFFRELYLYFRYPYMRKYYDVKFDLAIVWAKVNALEQYLRMIR